MPRQRTCCPFMQRTLYRVTRNLARLDLGFTCPDLDANSSEDSPSTPPLKKRSSPCKKKHRRGDRRDSERKTSSGGVLSWLVRGTLSRRENSVQLSDTLSSVPPIDSHDVENENENDMLNESDTHEGMDIEVYSRHGHDKIIKLVTSIHKIPFLLKGKCKSKCKSYFPGEDLLLVQ